MAPTDAASSPAPRHRLTSPAVRPASRVNPNAVLAVVAVAQFMVILDATIVNVALPTIQRDVGFSEQSLSALHSRGAIRRGRPRWETRSLDFGTDQRKVDPTAMGVPEI